LALILLYTTSVLKEIDDAIQKRVSSHPEPVQKLDRVSTWIRKKVIDVKSANKDMEKLQEMRGKLQNVIDRFTVRSSLLPDNVGAEGAYLHTQVSTLFRNELNALQNGRDVNAVRDLAGRILMLQVQEAGESSVFSPSVTCS
jgi:uncharacterized Ntn-hydrolase superfamily protein